MHFKIVALWDYVPITKWALYHRRWCIILMLIITQYCVHFDVFSLNLGLHFGVQQNKKARLFISVWYTMMFNSNYI